MSEEEGWAAIPRGMLRDPDVPQMAKLVYMALQSHVNYRTGTATVKMGTIAEYLGMSRRTVLRQLQWLRSTGIIEWSAHSDGDGRKPHRYRLVVAPDFQVQGDKESQRQSDRKSQAKSQRVTTQRVTESQQKEKSFNERTTTSSSSSADAPDSVKAPDLDDEPSEDVLRLCGLLADLIVANGSKRPTIGKTWLRACRLMLTVDGREPEKVETAIRWCQADEFWRGNILSMPKLRQQYDRLRLAAQRTQRLSANGRSLGDKQRETYEALMRLSDEEASSQLALEGSR